MKSGPVQIAHFNTNNPASKGLQNRRRSNGQPNGRMEGNGHVQLEFLPKSLKLEKLATMEKMVQN